MQNQQNQREERVNTVNKVVTVQSQRTSSIIVYTLARERRQHECRSHRVMHGGRRVVKRLAPVLLVVLAVLLAGCFGPPQTGLGTLVVESNPQGATVLLNGEDTGLKTPATLKEVRAGTHTVTVRYGNLEPQTERVSVRRGQTTVVQFFFETEVPPAQPDQAVVTGMVSENLGGRNAPGRSEERRVGDEDRSW